MPTAPKPTAVAFPRETIYFIAVATIGGVLWAVGQSWAVGAFGTGCIGAIAFGASAAWKRHKAKEPRPEYNTPESPRVLTPGKDDAPA